MLNRIVAPTVRLMPDRCFCLRNHGTASGNDAGIYPVHHVISVQAAIKNPINPEALRFATLEEQFTKHGHSLNKSGLSKGFGPVSHPSKRWSMARYVPAMTLLVYLNSWGRADYDL